LLLTSKDVKKIVRDCPLTQIMLETDAPWLGLNEKVKIVPKYQVRNEPLAVKLVAEKIATIKKIRFEEVDFQTTNNTLDFFKLRS
jgi:TatD DNase family protein